MRNSVLLSSNPLYENASDSSFAILSTYGDYLPVIITMLVISILVVRQVIVDRKKV
jgi:hypothetical protein